MRTIAHIFISAFLLLVPGVHAQGPIGNVPAENGMEPQPGGQKCVLSGVVTNAVSGAPVNKAAVALFSAKDERFGDPYGGITDTSGHFEMNGIDPGQYTVSVTRNGYLQQNSAATSSAGPISLLKLTPGQKMTNLSFRMTPQGVITGKIVDEDGEPVANAAVELRRDAAATQDQPNAGDRVMTNDLGVYRIFGVTPGRYYLKATLPQESYRVPSVHAGAKAAKTYLPAYYPGTSDAFAAAPIHITAGQESNADMKISKTAALQVSGRVVSSGQQFPNAAIFAVPKDSPAWNFNDRHYTRATSTGEWVISGLLPGSYTVVTDLLSNGGRFGARLPLEVGSENLQGLQLILKRNPQVAGQVRVEGGGHISFSGLKVELRPRQALTSMRYGWSEVSENGDFLLEDASPDKSDVVISGLPVGYYLKSVRLGGQEALDTGVEAGLGGSAKLELIVSPGGATLEGSVIDSQERPLLGAEILLIPDPSHRDRQQNYRTATTDRSGHFTLNGIRPGEYTVITSGPGDSAESMSPETREKGGQQSQSIRLEETDKKALQLKMTSVPKTE